MGRKRKQIDPEGSSKSSLPPCRVCDAPGAGFHYGANTCEACKGFFHRSLKINEQYKCEGSGKCVIEHGHTRLCQFCRYNKCLSVGMAKEAIKTGRYTSVKRTSDILEIKRLQAKKTVPHLLAGGQNLTFENLLPVGSDNGSESSFDSDSQSDPNSFVFGTKIEQKPSTENRVQGNSKSKETIIPNNAAGLTAEVRQKSGIKLCGQTTPKTESHCPMTCAIVDNFMKREVSPGVSTMHEIESLFFERLVDESHTHGYQHPSSTSPYSITSPLSITSSHESASDCSAAKPSPGMLTDATLSHLSSSTTPTSGSSVSASLYSPSSSTSINSPTVSLISPGTVAVSPTPSSSNEMAATQSLSHFDMQVCALNSPGETVCSRSVLDLYQDKDEVVRILLEADENYVVPLAGRLSDEEITRQQKEHFEECKLQQEMFGQLRRLPDHEYDYIFATTGLDMDDRQKRLVGMGAGLEKVIRAMVKFCKMIPGFSQLDIGDKVKLIKFSRQEFCIFNIYKFINAEKKIMRGLDCQWKCENEISRMSTNSESNIVMQRLEHHFRYCSSIQKLKLSDEELVIIRALIIMAPDRNPHVESELARDIHWQLNKCLIHVLSKRYPNPLFFYAKIMGKLTEARSQTENMIQFFKTLKIEKYSNLMDNPLLREMCSGIFFDDKEDDGSNFSC